MRNLKEILKLINKCTFSYREIGRVCGCSERTVRRVRDAAINAGITWPLPENMDDNALVEKMYGTNTTQRTNISLEPDVKELVKEMVKTKHVTMKLLHEEYKVQNPSGIGYTQFCSRIRSHQKKTRIWMPQLHKAGEALYVDWVGEKMFYTDADNGLVPVYLFVAVLGGSNYPYVEAFNDMATPSWLTAHINAFEYIKGIPMTVVPDNCKTAVKEANRYEPSLNQSYQDMGNYYGVTIIPARVRRLKINLWGKMEFS